MRHVAIWWLTITTFLQTRRTKSECPATPLPYAHLTPGYCLWRHSSPSLFIISLVRSSSTSRYDIGSLTRAYRHDFTANLYSKNSNESWLPRPLFFYTTCVRIVHTSSRSCVAMFWKAYFLVPMHIR